MTKIITKTAEQYRQEQMKRDQDSICPNCGKRGFGFIEERVPVGGFFSSKYETYILYKCHPGIMGGCGCEWKVKKNG